MNVGAAFVSLGDDGRKVALLMVDGGFAYVHATFDDWLVRAGAVAFPVFDTIFVDEFLCPLERHLRLIVAGCFVFAIAMRLLMRSMMLSMLFIFCSLVFFYLLCEQSQYTACEKTTHPKNYKQPLKKQTPPTYKGRKSTVTESFRRPSGNDAEAYEH